MVLQLFVQNHVALNLADLGFFLSHLLPLFLLRLLLFCSDRENGVCCRGFGHLQ